MKSSGNITMITEYEVNLTEVKVNIDEGKSRKASKYGCKSIKTAFSNCLFWSSLVMMPIQHTGEAKQTRPRITNTGSPNLVVGDVYLIEGEVGGKQNCHK